MAVCALAITLWSGPDQPAQAQGLELDTCASDYAREIRPLLRKYCERCHSAKRTEGDINFQAITTWVEVRKRLKTWQKAAEMLDSRQMPPREARQPTDAERSRLQTWVRGYLMAEAKARAGDPGPVVLRRLSNAEYTYTLRDLTGLASLDPAREFPIDGAAGEGFTNTGNALVMSPALLQKYLDAAKEVASHAVLLPDGFRFSTYTTRRDWTNEILTRIREFYRAFTDPHGANTVNLQGIVFATNEGGRLPLEKYMAATIEERADLLANRKTIAAVAQERGLNAKYLGTLWSWLTSNRPSLLLDRARRYWRAAEPADVPALVGSIVAWQESLWKFGTVGHIGKVGGPKRWLEAVNPLVAKQEVRFKLPKSKNGSDISLALVADDAGDGNEHDFVIWQQPRLVAPGRPDLLLRDVREVCQSRDGHAANSPAGGDWGLDSARFGRHPNGTSIDPASLCVHAPTVIEFRLPADLAAGRELVTSAVLDQKAGAEGSVQLRVVADTHVRLRGLEPGDVSVTVGSGPWTSDNRQISYANPILVNEGSATRRRLEGEFEEFRWLFPPALCYTKIVPVDEVVTLTLFYREDDHLARLMLDETQKAQLDRLWDELHYISQDACTRVDVLAQLIEYATQDADPKVFEPLRKPFQEQATAFRRHLIDTEPRHLDALVDFAARAYRRPLTEAENQELRALYRKLRVQGLSHEEAFRLTLARVLVAPAFLYRLEQPGADTKQRPVSDWELASRLSYFLWSSLPDEKLRQVAAAGRLHDTDTLLAQTRRMLRDGRVRRLATEFACQWLHVYDFDHLDEKSERHFPTFAALRGPMYEESIRFFTDLFQRDGSVLDILDADYTFLNGALAKNYEVPGVSGPEWRRVQGMKRQGRGGILGQASTLAKQSGASRTSPILRGNWISEVLLGERLPRPPKDVPRLPEDESATQGLTVRQLIEKHTSDAHCAVCHQRIDPFGFALEGFDAIGRKRVKDLGDRPIDTRAKAPDGAQFEGLDGLRNYLLTEQRDAFVRQFCRKLLGYALGRAIQLSDEPLLAEMQAQLKAKDYRFTAALEPLVRGRQFREIRGRLAASED
jgi:hypothetical protein